MTATIINTRPLHQSQNLTNMLETAGFDVYHLPLLAIKPVEFKQPDLNNINCLIFLSANAVTHFFSSYSPEHLKKQSNKQPTIVAIGPATQKSLHAYGLTDIIVPSKFCSEGILELSYFKNPKDINILIVSGKDPNPTLFRALSNAGATIKSIVCYKRICNALNTTAVFNELQKREVKAIITTSHASLMCLISSFADPQHKAWLSERCFIVTSEKARETCLNHQLNNTIIAKNATDAEITQEAIDLIQH